MSVRPWDEEERAWARECLLAGDTPEEVAEMAGRSVEDVRAHAGLPIKLTPHRRRVLRLYGAGYTFAEIGRELWPGIDVEAARKRGAAVIAGLRQKGVPVPRRVERGAP